MSRFIPGDYVRPTNTDSGLPRGSVWVVRHYHNNTDTLMELGCMNTGRNYYPPSLIRGCAFNDCNFEKVVMVEGHWMAAKPSTVMNAPEELYEQGVPNDQEEEDPVEYADKMVERAVATLDAAKENARKAREEARAVAKSEAKRKSAVEAAKKAREERIATGNRLASAHDLALATVALIKEIIRLHNGGAEQTAASDIAAHADQLQPLAKSYGYKIAKPGVIAIVVKA